MAIGRKPGFIDPKDQAYNLATEGLSFLTQAEEKLTASIGILDTVAADAAASAVAAQNRQAAAEAAKADNEAVLANLRALRQPVAA
jgi:hypothetical protein